MDRKLCGNRRNCLLRAISPFTTVFSKRLELQTREILGLFGKGTKFINLQQNTIYFIDIVIKYGYLSAFTSILHLGIPSLPRLWCLENCNFGIGAYHILFFTGKKLCSLGNN